jgi:L-ascorbate metabolism protein UlaG (beta-lactamase superfamily)
MKITHYLYNSFIIESDNKKIAIDPGALFGYWFSFRTLIPKSEWKNITHILVTHGDPDHYWHVDRMADVSGAPVILNRSMIEKVNGEEKLLGPRSKGLKFDTPFGTENSSIRRVSTLDVDETIEMDGMTITGIKMVHGPLKIRIGPLKKTVTPGPGERIGRGAIGFRIELDGKTLINLGDSLLLEKDWEQYTHSDVLMLPIGGKKVDNTMDENEALKAVEIMKPGLVIPTHYNCPILFSRRGNPADDRWFRDEVKKLGFSCSILVKGESITI